MVHRQIGLLAADARSGKRGIPASRRAIGLSQRQARGGCCLSSPCASHQSLRLAGFRDRVRWNSARDATGLSSHSLVQGRHELLDRFRFGPEGTERAGSTASGIKERSPVPCANVTPTVGLSFQVTGRWVCKVLPIPTPKSSIPTSPPYNNTL